MTRSQLKNQINRRICGVAPGVFSDDHWEGKRIVEKALYSILNKHPEVEILSGPAVYRNDEEGRPNGKTWTYYAGTGKPDGKHVMIFIVAAGAGTLADPLSHYDIVAYAN
jgi:hypothetical protein